MSSKYPTGTSDGVNNSVATRSITEAPRTAGQQQAISTNRPLPQHIAVIMDGNGRWAEKRNLPRIEGHSTKFVATFLKVFSNIIVLFSWKRTTSNSRRICLQNTNSSRDPSSRNTRTTRNTNARRVAARDKWEKYRGQYRVVHLVHLRIEPAYHSQHNLKGNLLFRLHSHGVFLHNPGIDQKSCPHQVR